MGRYGDQLRVLSQLGPLQLDALLPHLSLGLLGAVDNCCHNCLVNTQAFPPTTRVRLRRALKKYRTHLVPLMHGQPRGNLRQRTRHLRQRGGFAGAIASAVLSAAIPLLVDAVRKKLNHE